MTQVTYVLPGGTLSPEEQLSMDAAQLLHQTMDLALQCHRAKDWEQAALLYQVALMTLGWLLTTNAPTAAPPIVAISKGSAVSTTPILPPCKMNTPKTQIRLRR